MDLANIYTVGILSVDIPEMQTFIVYLTCFDSMKYQNFIKLRRLWTPETQTLKTQ